MPGPFRGDIVAGIMNEVVRTLENYDHRSEILSSGTKYYVQSSLIPALRVIATSLFHEGNLLTRQIADYDGTVSGEPLRAMVRRVAPTPRRWTMTVGRSQPPTS